MDLTTLAPGDWTVLVVVAFALVFLLLRLVQPRERLLTSRHTLWEGNYLTPSYVCRGCQREITGVVRHPTGALACPRCAEPIPVLDWIDDTHIEVLL